MKIEFNPTMSDSMFVIFLILVLGMFLFGIVVGFFAFEKQNEIDNFSCDDLFAYIKSNDFSSSDLIKRYFEQCKVEDNQKEIWHDYTQDTEITNSIDWNDLPQNQTAIIEWKMKICESTVYIIPLKTGEPYYDCLDWGSHNLESGSGKQ